MEGTSPLKSSLQNSKTLGYATLSGNWKKVNLHAMWDATDAIWARQAQKERLTSKLIANLEAPSDSPTAPNSSKGIGKLHENRVKLALNTVQKRKLELVDLGSLEPQSLTKDNALTSCNANECLTKEEATKISQTVASSPGPSTTKVSKSTEESSPSAETSKLKFMYSGEQLEQERLDSLSSLQTLEQPTGWHLTPAGLMTMKAKRQSYSMTSMGPSPTHPCSGSWIEPNFAWKAKGVTLTSWLKDFSSRVTSSQGSGTMVVNILWMPYDAGSITNSTSSATTSAQLCEVTHSPSSGKVGEIPLE